MVYKIVYTFAEIISGSLSNDAQIAEFLMKKDYKDNTPPLPLIEAHLGGFLFDNL